MNAQMPTTHRNGLDLVQMHETIDALKNNPPLAMFEFRASNQWINGGENRSTIRGFFGPGAEDQCRTTDCFYTDGEPPVLLGKNEGANPVEYLLHALAGCVTTTTVLHAAARGITIRKMSTKLSGNINLEGLLALDDKATVGYESIRIMMDIDADCSDKEVDELLSFAKNHSPVCSTINRPVEVTLERV